MRLARCLLLSAFACASLPARATTFVVTRLDDPAPGACAPADCSLREAVAAANSAPGNDVIDLPAGTLAFGAGEIAITGDVSIQGEGLATTTLHNTLPILFRVDHATLVLADATIDGPPLLRQSPSTDHAGASPLGTLPVAIDGHDDAGITLRRVHVPITGGLVQLGGGTQCDLDVADADVDVLHVTDGGGQAAVVDSTISMLYVNGDVDVQVSRTRVRGDTEPPVGGGIGLSTSGGVRIADTELDGALQGIIVQATAPALLDLLRLDVHADSGPLHVLTPAALTLTDSTFRDNSATGGRPGAVHLSNGADATIRGSAFIDNKGDGDTGGAVLVEAGAHALIVNSTFSSNSFTVAAAGAGARGSAIGVRGSAGSPPSVLLNHVTIVAPAFGPVGVEGTAIGVRGADSDSNINVHNSVLRGSCRFQNVIGGSFGLSVGNIESPGHGCGLDTSTNLVDTDPADLALGTLGDHGGRTPTYLPAADSRVVGNAEPTICLGDDQRGYLRTLDDGCDVGAVEVDGIDILFADGFDG